MTCKPQIVAFWVRRISVAYVIAWLRGPCTDEYLEAQSIIMWHHHLKLPLLGKHLHPAILREIVTWFQLALIARSLALTAT